MFRRIFSVTDRLFSRQQSILFLVGEFLAIPPIETLFCVYMNIPGDPWKSALPKRAGRCRIAERTGGDEDRLRFRAVARSRGTLETGWWSRKSASKSVSLSGTLTRLAQDVNIAITPAGRKLNGRSSKYGSTSRVWHSDTLEWAAANPRGAYPRT